MAFREQLSQYMIDMKLSQPKLAEVLGHKSVAQVRSYLREKDTRTPTASGLLDIASRLGVTVDWLLGRPGSEKWTADIHHLRSHVRAIAPTIDAQDVGQRVKSIIRACQQYLPLFGEPWFLAGVLQITEKDLNSLLNASGPISQHNIKRLAEFLHLPEAWLWEGKPEQLNEVDLAGYAEALSILMKNGITPHMLKVLTPEITRMAGVVTRLVDQAKNK